MERREDLNGEMTIWRTIHYLVVEGEAVNMTTGEKFDKELKVNVICRGKSRRGVWDALIKKLKEMSPEGYTLIKYRVLEDRCVTAAMTVEKFLANADRVLACEKDAAENL